MAHSLHQLLLLPHELWLHIVKIAVEPAEWDKRFMFFPPSENFNQIEGFKNASRRFRALVSETENIMGERSISVHSDSDVQKLVSLVKQKRVRHLRIQECCGANLDCATTNILENFSNLESISLTLKYSELVLFLHMPLLPLSLRRLDLTCSQVNRGPTIALPNLVELRLSKVRPTMWTRDYEEFMVESFVPRARYPNYDEALNAFIGDMKLVLGPLRRLRLLSFRVSLRSNRVLDFTRQHHEDLKNDHTLWPDFRTCLICRPRIAGMEREELIASKKFAELLPELERVRWMDVMRAEYFDEECQKEYRIARDADGNIEVQSEP